MPFYLYISATRLLYVVNFSIVVFSAFGFDYFNKNKERIIVPLVFIALIFGGLWVTLNSIVLPGVYEALPENLVVTFSNLRLPSALFLLTSVIIVSDV